MGALRSTKPRTTASRRCHASCPLRVDSNRAFATAMRGAAAPAVAGEVASMLIAAVAHARVERGREAENAPRLGDHVLVYVELVVGVLCRQHPAEEAVPGCARRKEGERLGRSIAGSGGSARGRVIPGSR